MPLKAVCFLVTSWDGGSQSKIRTSPRDKRYKKEGGVRVKSRLLVKLSSFLHLLSQIAVVGCGISSLTFPSSPEKEIPNEKVNIGIVDCYQLCGSLPQPWGHIKVSLVPASLVKDTLIKFVSCSLTCWEGSSSFCSQQNSRPAPFPTPAGEQGRWWSGRLATCSCLSGSLLPGSCSARQRWSAGTLRSW